MRLMSRRSRCLFFPIIAVLVLLNLWVVHELSRYQDNHSDNNHPLLESVESVGKAQQEAVNKSSHYDRHHSQREGTPSAEEISFPCGNRQYNGILHICMGDIGGAGGTIFFQFVLAQLIYAEQYQLLPWIHFNNVSNVTYDERVHGVGPGVTLTFRGVGDAVDIVRRNGDWRDRIPGAPQFGENSSYTTLHFPGTGVWSHYFLPVQPSLNALDGARAAACARTLPYMTLTLKQITPGLHGFVDWAPRCWRYRYLPDYMTQPHLPLHEWLRPSQLLGHKAVERYRFQLQPHLVQVARRANPQCAPPTDGAASNNNNCLGLHIRHSDKAAGRRQVPVSEFWPFVQAFVREQQGDYAIYVATDSTLVLQEIADTWPAEIQVHIYSLGSSTGDQKVIRSSGVEAVFDMHGATQHHQTNTEVLIEIMALSWCRFLVHGLSAVSESSIWLRGEPLISSSVNLEDPDHLNVAQFATLVQMVLRSADSPDDDDTSSELVRLPRPRPSTSWWKVRETFSQQEVLETGACSGFKGILLISSTGGDQKAIGSAFFTHVLNQLLYAEKHRWIPFVYLRPYRKKDSALYDRWAHRAGGNNVTAIQYQAGYIVPMQGDGSGSGYPDAPIPGEQLTPSVLSLAEGGNGIWESYLEQPVITSAQLQADSSCRGLPLVKLSDHQVVSLTNNAPYAIRAWRYDEIPEQLWWSEKENHEMSLTQWYAPMRQRGQQMMQKYYRFRSYLTQRAKKVNPVRSEEDKVCLSVHLRNGNKRGKFRERVSSQKFLDYMISFLKAGGNSIFVATDSHRVMQYMQKNFPASVLQSLHIQGTTDVVRTTKEWPLHMIESTHHHRVNSEALVDVLALSQCHFLLHTHSTISEAAIYLNPVLQNNSINFEDPRRLSADDFGAHVSEFVRHREVRPRASPAGRVAEHKMENATILIREGRGECRKNALVYLAQKQHSSYTGKDSYSSLLRSLNLIQKNYLGINNHAENVDVFVFHTNDFTHEDLDLMEQQLGGSGGMIRLVNLAGSVYWRRPPHHRDDNPDTDWYAYPLFSEGYRRMMHFFAIDIWDFFAAWNAKTGCEYRYLFRLDEDSFVHSPIRYDLFDFMKERDYAYGYRLCTYEMQVTKRMWTLYTKRNPSTFRPHRQVDLNMCGFYNNFFVADLQFFTSPSVQKFLHFIDRQGQIYRRRLGDLMIHSMTVYAFCEPHRIHRFLDFTYEHGTTNQTGDGCLVWGGIQAGYDDENASAVVNEFYNRMVERNNATCLVNTTMLPLEDLSPSYAHIPSRLVPSPPLTLHTLTAGRVEFPLRKGILSG